MDCRNWPLGRIVQLPDECFGRRYWIGTYLGNSNGQIYYEICEDELPDVFVLWGAMFCCRAPSMAEAMRLTVRLGDHEPASVADAQVMERLFKRVSVPTIFYEFYLNGNGLTWIEGLRCLVEAQNHRLCLVSNGDQANAYEATFAILVSPVATEVPEWLISAQGKNLL